jgi:hypothetical protein
LPASSARQRDARTARPRPPAPARKGRGRTARDTNRFFGAQRQHVLRRNLSAVALAKAMENFLNLVGAKRNTFFGAQRQHFFFLCASA